MLNGKKTVYIDFNNFLESPNEDNFNSDTEFHEIPDAVRYYSKNFWSVKDNKATLANEINNSSVLYKINYISDNSIELIANKTQFINSVINEAGVLEERFDHKKWEQFLKDIIPGTNSIFLDNYVLIDEFSASADPNSADPNISYINREFVYNFFSEKYENLSLDRTVDPTTLPSIYTLLSNKRTGETTREENMVLSLGGLINQNYIDSLYISKDFNMIKPYFEEYSEKYVLPQAKTVINQLEYESFNVSIYKDSCNILKKIDFIPFPYYCDIKFYNLAKNKDNIIHYMSNIGKIIPDLLKHIKENTENLEEKSYLRIADIPERKILNQFDLKYWINKEIEGELNYGTADGERIYNENSRIYSQIEYTNLIEYIKNNIKPKIRKYKDFTTKSSEQHTLLYKIEKRQFNSNTQPLQTFWITPDDTEFIRFIDTQIKYGIEYYYSIMAYILVVGNEYYYEQNYYKDEKNRKHDLHDGKYKINIANKPSYKILEVNIGEFVGAIHENPYTKPNIKIEKDADNIRINMLESAASSFEEFEIIENKDFNMFESIRRSQENNEIDKIKSIAPKASKYGLQIYKTHTKPVSYLSFQGNLYKTLSISNEKSFLETIIPNNKCWYLFRYLNNHNIPSNVSDIYEVEMKNEDGYSYLNVSILDLKKGAQKLFYKNMKRYLLIRPSIIQTQVKSPEIIKSIYDINLGPKDSSVWDRDFIIRLTSKKTNRVLEFNLKSIINRKKE